MRGVAEGQTEQESVERWRAAELLRAGYDKEAVAVLAICTDVDLHEAVALIRSGCAQDVALKILL